MPSAFATKQLAGLVLCAIACGPAVPAQAQTPPARQTALFSATIQATEEAILNDFVRIRDESRTSTAVLDPTAGTYTEINEWGPSVKPEELDILREKIDYLSQGARLVVFAGSLPRDVEDDFYAEMMHPHEFEDYPVWVRSTKFEPSVHYPGRRWAFWQYQSDGQVPGIRGNVDRNAFHGTQQQWAAFAKEKYAAAKAKADEALKLAR